ncbi:hypothetical protein Slin15195_G092170 [Septoria linicola]|uniref:Uncharacterized protein n=1 Tax=Septoria linicola TaxID=215465 RepID=A0A9Q9AZ66_9PEZI|nr:hypothetical protein Slin14017_G055290 [Septoria linicola]USW55898.1 hypothetical protein Slin15195_G092170 [Septoria linicola]
MRSIMALPLALAALLLQLAMAIPAMHEDIAARSTLESRAEAKILAPIVVGLYICTGPEWTGQCAHLKNGPAICINFDQTFAGQITSVGPDAEASGCTFFTKPNCDLSGENISGTRKPGNSNLGLSPFNGKYDNAFFSYICY